VTEALWYTWASHGQEGIDQFQVVATTPGLADLTSEISRTARQLCHYRMPAGVHDEAAAPISFGWIDVKGVRFAFRRGPNGTDRWQRAGNFAAHIVLGPVQELPALDILSSFDSEIWWRGDLDQRPADGILGDPRLDSNTSGSQLGPDTSELQRQLTAALLDRPPDGQIAAAVTPTEMVAAARAVANVIPALVEAVSFSTYEPDQAGWFDIIGANSNSVRAWRTVGGVTATSDMPTTRTSIVAALTLDPANNARRATRAAREAASMPGSFDRRVYLHVRSALDAVESNGDPAMLAPALSYPDAAAALLAMPDVRAQIADALGRRDAEILANLERSAPALSSDGQENLGLLLGELLTNRHAMPKSDAIMLTSHFSDVAAATAARFALNHWSRHMPSGSDLRGITTHSAAPFVREAGLTVTPAPVIYLILDAIADDPTSLVADRTVPEAWRSRLVANAVEQRASLSAVALRQLIAEPGIAVGLTEAGLSLEGATALVKRYQPGEVSAFARAAITGMPDMTAIQFLETLPPPSKIDALDAVCQSGRASPAWTTVAIDPVLGALNERLTSIRGDPAPKIAELNILHHLGGSRGARWGKLLRVVQALRRERTRQARTRLCTSALHLLHGAQPGDRMLAARLVADEAVAASQSVAELEQRRPFIDLAAETTSESPAGVILRSALSRALEGQTRPATIGLMYVSTLIADGTLATKRHQWSRHAADNGVRDLVRQTVASLPKSVRETLADHAPELRQAARQWLEKTVRG
jgi:GTPase-associated protein 1